MRFSRGSESVRTARFPWVSGPDGQILPGLMVALAMSLPWRSSALAPTSGTILLCPQPVDDAVGVTLAGSARIAWQGKAGGGVADPFMLKWTAKLKPMVMSSTSET